MFDEIVITDENGTFSELNYLADTICGDDYDHNPDRDPDDAPNYWEDCYV